VQPRPEVDDLHFHATTPTNPDKAAAPLRWKRADRRSAVRFGERVMRAFATQQQSLPDVTSWWQQLEPLLSSQAARDYSSVDPANVPVHQITGAPRLAPTPPLDEPVLAIVHVPTDAGLYAVIVSRSAQDTRWRAERITPPELDPHRPGDDVSPSPEVAPR
jgi:hypothetical protein